ncbi:MAG: rod shape-determining protein MreD [Coxiellaceae bacterium]|nr:rod shape-determining protein MreD [Coxiellaceae bacterium]
MSSKPPLFLTLLYIGLASIFLIIPLPHWANALRPQWMLLLILVWISFYRNYTSLAVVFILGLFVDLLLGSLLGQHAFGYIVVVYFYMRFQDRIVQFHLMQQTACLLLLSAINWFAGWGLALAFTVNVPSFTSLFSVLTTAILWPWLMMLFNAIGHHRSTVSFTRS